MDGEFWKVPELVDLLKDVLGDVQERLADTRVACTVDDFLVLFEESFSEVDLDSRVSQAGENSLLMVAYRELVFNRSSGWGVKVGSGNVVCDLHRWLVFRATG